MNTGSAVVALLTLSLLVGDCYAQALPLLTGPGHSELDPSSLQRVANVVPTEGRVTDSFFVVLPAGDQAPVALEKAGVRAALRLQVHLGPSVQSTDYIKNFVNGVSGDLTIMGPESPVWRLRVNSFLRFVPIVLFEE